MRIRRVLQNPASRNMLLVGLGILGAGAYWLTRKPRRAAPVAKPEGPVPDPADFPPTEEGEAEEPPPAVLQQIHQIPGVGAAKVYPTGAADFPVPDSPTDVAFTEDCMVITVPQAWWESTAIAIFNSMWQDGQRDPEPIADTIAKTEISHCADYDTDAVSQFLSALDSWVRERISELVQPTQLQQ